MKVFFLVFFLSSLAFAKQYNVSGRLDFEPDGHTTYRVHRVALEPSTKFDIGVDLATGGFADVPTVGSMTGLGFTGDYHLDRHWALEGRLFISNYAQNFFTCDWDCDQFYHHTYSYSQTDVTFGPVYRLLTSRVSPIIGGYLGYEHQYYLIPYGWTYYGQADAEADSLTAGGLVGLDFRLSRDVSLDLTLRDTFPLATGTSNIPYYVPRVAGAAYYTAAIGLKFSF